MAVEINYTDPPKKNLEELLSIYKLDRYLILDEVLESNRSFKVVFQDLIDILKNGYEIKEVRTRPVKFKFHTRDRKVHTLELRHFLSNLILWRAFIDIDKVDILSPMYIYDFSKFNINSVIKYINEMILPVHDGDFASKNECVDEISYAITAIAHAFCPLFGVSLSIHNLIDLEKRYPEIHDIIRGDIPADLQPHEVEDYLNTQTNRLIELITSDPQDNDLKPLFLAGKNISNLQFREYLLHIGLKPDINGNTIPVLINDNFLHRGLTKPSSLYVNASAGRRSLMLTKLSMGIPGAFSKKLNAVATAPGILRQDNEMCESITTVDYIIRDKQFLKMLNGRYYYDQYGIMQILDSSADDHLIGKVVRFRSPATCASDDGQTICKYCYGHLYDINKDLFSTGALAATKLSEPGGQSVLSNKHETKTDSAQITMPDGFDKLFEINSSDVMIREDSELEGSYYIVLKDVKIEESDDTEFYYVEEFDIIDKDNAIVFHVKEDHDARMYLGEEILAYRKKMKDKSAPIPMDELDEEASLFTIEIKSATVTNLIEVLQKTLNTNDHMGARTVSELCQTFADSLIHFGITYDLVHAECIIRALMRKKTNVLEFPDWTSGGNPNDYQMLSLNSALLKNPSALVSMSYGYLRRQLVSAELYLKKAPSHLDPLFVRRLSDHIDD